MTAPLVPQNVFVTKGVGRHRDQLQSFEMALRDAGIEHLNLVMVSNLDRHAPGLLGGGNREPSVRASLLIAQRMEGVEHVDGNRQHDGVRSRGPQPIDRLQGP